MSAFLISRKGSPQSKLPSHSEQRWRHNEIRNSNCDIGGTKTESQEELYVWINSIKPCLEPHHNWGLVCTKTAGQ